MMTGRKPNEHPGRAGGSAVLERPGAKGNDQARGSPWPTGKLRSAPLHTEGTWYDSLPRSTRWPTIAGILIMAVMLMGFGVWGNTAPIAGAVVASGVFVVTGQNKIIQHLEGGVIREIYVREGDTVEAGQMLARAGRDHAAGRAATAVPAPPQADGHRCEAAGRDEGRREVTFPAEIGQFALATDRPRQRRSSTTSSWRSPRAATISTATSRALTRASRRWRSVSRDRGFSSMPSSGRSCCSMRKSRPRTAWCRPDWCASRN